MKTQVAQLRKERLLPKRIQYALFILCLMMTMALNAVYAQTNKSINEITVKGIVSDEAGPLTGVNIALEGSNVGAITDTDGSFIFPATLNVGDILVFSYLGYQTERIKVKEDTSVINLEMTAEYIDIVGALSSNTPYKSKRSR